MTTEWLQGKLRLTREERNDLVKKSSINFMNLKKKQTNSVQNRYADINDTENVNIEEISNNLTTVLRKAFLKVGGKRERQNQCKLSSESSIC